MAKVLSSHCSRPLGCAYRAYRHHPSAHAIVQRWDVAKHPSRCPVFSRWLWNGRVLNVPDRDLGRFSRVSFVRVPVILLHQGASHD